MTFDVNVIVSVSPCNKVVGKLAIRLVRSTIALNKF